MPNIMRVRTVFTYGSGDPGLMTHYFRAPTLGPPGTAAQDAVNRVRDMLLTMPTMWPAGWVSTVQGDVEILNDATGEVVGAEAATGAFVNGTAGGGLGPLAVGLLMVLNTGAFVSGRRLRGRTFIVPCSAAAANAPKPSDATRATVVTMGNALLAAGTTGVFPVVWSRPRLATAVGPGRPDGPARAARAGSSADVTTISCPAKFVVLTSRRD